MVNGQLTLSQSLKIKKMGKMIQLANMALVNNGLTPATKSGKPVHRVHTLSLSQAINLTLISEDGHKIKVSEKSLDAMAHTLEMWVITGSGYVLDLEKIQKDTALWVVEDIKDAIFDELLDGGSFEDLEGELRYFCGVVRHSKLDKDIKKGVLKGLYNSLRSSNLRKFWVELRKAQMAQ